MSLCIFNNRSVDLCCSIHSVNRVNWVMPLTHLTFCWAPKISLFFSTVFHPRLQLPDVVLYPCSPRQMVSKTKKKNPLDLSN